MARHRSDKSHRALPPYVYIRRGWYVYREHLGKGKLGKDIKLCKDDALISEVWQRYESLKCESAPKKTLDWLMHQYFESAQFREKLPKTQKEYRKSAAQISKTTLKNGELFGGIDADRITPGILTRYADARKKANGEPAPIAANRELALLSVCYSWAVARDYLRDNPCKGAERNTERPCKEYPTDAQYAAIYDLAKDLPHIQCAMEIAYLCRMRTCEVLDIRYSDLLENGILVRRRKGSRDNITLWNPRLEAAVRAAKGLPMPSVRPIDSYLIRSKTGDRLTESGLATLWQRLMKKAEAEGLQRFRFHSLKAKGISDTEGDKQAGSGHKTAAMVTRYDRKLAEVKPAGKE